MAQNYTLFSVALEKLTDQEVDWWAKKIEEVTEDEFNDDGPNGAIFDLNLETKEIWIYAEESGNIEYVADALQAFLAANCPDKYTILTWAVTCSRPRPGEFSGGGVLISATEQKWFVPDFLIQKELESK